MREIEKISMIEIGTIYAMDKLWYSLVLCLTLWVSVRLYFFNA